MQTKLAEFGIPTDTLKNATLAIEGLSDSSMLLVCGAFGLSPKGEDLSTTTRFVADAVIRGADSVDKVVGYVRKRLLGQAPAPVVLNVPVTIVGSPVVDNETVTVAPVVDLEPSVAPVRYGRGRRKNGKSDFCKAVKVIGALGDSVDRVAQLAALSDAGFNKSSSAVYLWRFNRGERD